MNRPFAVLVDPGHGGKDPGACGIEAQINLLVALSVRTLLRSIGFSCWLTRKDISTFVSLQDRCRMEWDLRPALFLSLHCNSAGLPDGSVNPVPQGIEVWTSPGQTKSDPAATCIFTSLQHAFPERTFRKDMSDGDPDKEARFRVLTGTLGPAVLVEMGFVSNPAERAWLERTETQVQMAMAICAGILAWRQHGLV